MFFQMSALTVGITKNGAITSKRGHVLAEEIPVKEHRKERPQDHGDH